MLICSNMNTNFTFPLMNVQCDKAMISSRVQRAAGFQGNVKSAGFTDEERTSFKTNFLEQGFVDTFRKQHPNAVSYTYWGYRTAARPKNQGNLGYFRSLTVS